MNPKMKITFSRIFRIAITNWLRLGKIPYSVVYFLLPLLLLGRALCRGRVLYWGLPVLQFIPWRVLAYEMMEKGIWPLWNPLNGLGSPLLANYQLAWFYPLSWVLGLFYGLGGTPWLAWGFTMLAAFHLGWAGWGMARLLKSLGYGDLAQAIAGMAFGFSQYFIARINFFSMIWAGAWLPWVICGVENLINAPSRSALKSRLLSLALVLAMQLLAGHAQLTWYTWLLAGAWGILRGRQVHGRKWGYLVSYGSIALIWAVGLSLAQILPTAEYLLTSQRSTQVDYEQAMTYSLWPWRLTGFIAPHLFGNPGTDVYWGYANYWEDAIYIGFLPFLMALTTLREAFRSSQGDRRKISRSVVRTAWGIVLVSIVLALGKNTPVYPFLYHYIPTFDMFQAPSRWLIWTIFGLAVLSGIGVENWQKPKGRTLYVLRLSVMAAVAIMLSAWLAREVLSDLKPSFATATFQFGLVALGGVVVLLATPQESARSGWRLGWGWSLLAWVIVDILLAARGLLPTLPMKIYESLENMSSLRAQVGEGRLYLPEEEEYVLKFKDFFRFDRYAVEEKWQELRYSLLPNLNLLESIASLNNFDPLLPGCYVALMNEIEAQPETIKTAWLQDLNVSLIEQRDERLQRVSYRQLAAKGRWQWFTCVKMEPTLFSALTALRGMINSDTRCMILTGTQQNLETTWPASEARVVWVADQPNSMLLEVETSGPGWLRLSVLWYPGWKVVVDGISRESLRADGCLQAVWLTSGKHSVQFVYDPLSFKIGAWGSLLAWIMWITLGLKSLRNQGLRKGS